MAPSSGSAARCLLSLFCAALFALASTVFGSPARRALASPNWHMAALNRHRRRELTAYPSSCTWPPACHAV